MMLETTPFDASNYLDTPEAIAAFLTDAFEEGDAAVISHALGVVAKAQGMSRLAHDTGLSRQALYRSLSTGGRPELLTVLKVLNALGIRLAATAVA